MKFAQPLYDIQEFVYERISKVYERPKTFTKDRKLLQFLGTDWGRDVVSSSLWIDLWKQEVMELNKNFSEVGLSDAIIVVDDVRFDNEAETIKAFAGLIIEVRSKKTSERIDTARADHKSENGVSLDYVDAIIENDGSIEDLEGSLFMLNSLKRLW